jgi:hypothetical protein
MNSTKRSYRNFTELFYRMQYVSCREILLHTPEIIPMITPEEKTRIGEHLKKWSAHVSEMKMNGENLTEIEKVALEALGYIYKKVVFDQIIFPDQLSEDWIKQIQKHLLKDYTNLFERINQIPESKGSVFSAEELKTMLKKTGPIVNEKVNMRDYAWEEMQAENPEQDLIIYSKDGIFRLNLRQCKEHRELMTKILEPYHHLFIEDHISQYPMTPAESFKVPEKHPRGERAKRNIFYEETGEDQIEKYTSCLKSLLVNNKIKGSERTARLEALFGVLFPFAPKNLFEVAMGKVYVETELRNYVAYLNNSESKKDLFKKMFPGATDNDFKKLDNRQAVTDELSFMEKFEKLIHEEFIGNIDRNELEIRFTKLCRQEIDVIIQAIKGSKRKSAERSTAIRKATEAVMWLGMDLKDIGTENPYPESKNPANTKIEPTADGLKL